MVPRGREGGRETGSDAGQGGDGHKKPPPSTDRPPPLPPFSFRLVLKRILQSKLRVGTSMRTASFALTEAK